LVERGRCGLNPPTVGLTNGEALLNTRSVGASLALHTLGELKLTP